jgi:putative sterol carrier protein
MTIYFPSDSWIKKLQEVLNINPAYAEAAKNWEGDILFVIEPGGNLVEPVLMYMDLYHGKCREAYVISENGKTVKTAFKITAPVAVWKKVIVKQLDVMQAMVTGQLRLQGNMAMVMKNVRAAKELVNSCSLVSTEFPL